MAVFLNFYLCSIFGTSMTRGGTSTPNHDLHRNEPNHNIKISHRKLPRLRSINLSNNQLTSISRGSLPDSIEDAWLDSNLVETISRKIFSNLSNMKRVYLMNVSTNLILLPYKPFPRTVLPRTNRDGQDG